MNISYFKSGVTGDYFGVCRLCAFTSLDKRQFTVSSVSWNGWEVKIN